jgi:hypothetical protein
MPQRPLVQNGDISLSPSLPGTPTTITEQLSVEWTTPVPRIVQSEAPFMRWGVRRRGGGRRVVRAGERAEDGACQPGLPHSNNISSFALLSILGRVNGSSSLSLSQNAT